MSDIDRQRAKARICVTRTAHHARTLQNKPFVLLDVRPWPKRLRTLLQVKRTKELQHRPATRRAAVGGTSRYRATAMQARENQRFVA